MKTENRKQKTENRKQKVVGIALIILSLLFIFSCKKHSNEKNDEEVVNHKVIGFMSYTETERSIIDFDFSKEDTVSNDYTLERLEDGTLVITTEDEDDISIGEF